MTKVSASFRCLFLLLLTVGAAGSARAQSPSLGVVRHLAAGANSVNPLTLASDGHFYGTTGDTPGSIYRLSPGGTYTKLRSFPGPDNWEASSALVEGPDGHFYGTTLYGGIANLGTVFRVSRAGAFSILHHFTTEEGGGPTSLVVGRDGRLYGTTSRGRTSSEIGGGTVFRLTTTGAFIMLADIPSSWGEYAGTLAAGPDGNFYGLTYHGISGNGRLFRVTSAGAITSLGAVRGNTAAYQTNLMLASDGAFYGTTFDGGSRRSGQVFRANIAGEVIILATFDAFNGSNPSRLREGLDGLLYGSTANGLVRDPVTGDAVPSNGTLFSVTKAGILASLVSFGAMDTASGLPAPGGVAPYGGVAIDASGALWGTTFGGGQHDGGVIFRYGLPLPVSALRILNQPASVNAGTGDAVKFKVVVQGSGKALNYQWLKNGKPIGNSSVVSGAKTSTLTLKNVGLTAAGSYSVVVSEASLSVTSETAQLRVAFADSDKDGVSNDLDRNPGTARGDVVNQNGGSIAQLVPVNGKWKSFNQYLAALTRTVNDFRKTGLITAKEASQIILQATLSKSRVKITG